MTQVLADLVEELFGYNPKTSLPPQTRVRFWLTEWDLSLTLIVELVLVVPYSSHHSIT